MVYGDHTPEAGSQIGEDASVLASPSWKDEHALTPVTFEGIRTGSLFVA